jgi:MFS family permease
MIVSITAFYSGYMIGLLSAVILYIPFSYELSVMETTLIVSVILLGMLLGNLASGMVGDRLGRRPILVISAMIGLLAATLSGFAPSVWAIIIGRLFTGLSIGLNSVGAGLFLAEIAPSKIRGSLQGYGELAGWVGGILANLCALPIVIYLDKTVSWRIVFLIGAVLHIPAIVATLFALPESPRWLVLHQREDEALKVLKTIYGPGEDEQLQKELEILKDYAGQQMQEQSSFGALLKKENRHAVLVALILHLLQQLSGNNIITYYSSIILHDLGFVREMSIGMT